MNEQTITFQVTHLAAMVPEGVPIAWQGREFSSGPLSITLDPEAGAQASQGVLDYDQGYAQVTFHVQVQFPELADILQNMNVDPALTKPVQAAVHSEGAILNDHSFALSGRTELGDHAIFSPADTAASVLPGR